MMIKGFNICNRTIAAIYAPHADAKNRNQIIWQQHIVHLPDLIKFIVLIKEPNELANLFLPKAADGGGQIVVIYCSAYN